MTTIAAEKAAQAKRRFLVKLNRTPVVCRRLLLVTGAVFLCAWLWLWHASSSARRSGGSKVYNFHQALPALAQTTAAYFHADPAHPAVQAQLARDRDPGTRRRVIAMSLYGTQEAYVSGVVENALIVRREWPGWQLRVYHDRTVPEWALRVLRELHVDLVEVDRASAGGAHGGLFWRFYVLTDPTVTRFLVRDPDSRLTKRDRMCVQEWLDASGANESVNNNDATSDNQKKYDDALLFHSIRDHFYHGIPIMGAMWGAVGGLIKSELLDAYKRPDKLVEFNEDQVFLRDLVWPHVRNVTLVHDSFFCQDRDLMGRDNRPIPVRRMSKYDFIGNTYLPSNEYQGLLLNKRCPVACRPYFSWEWC